jgi:UDP:flavonoid glycosyltransferase YjiC (YdhE family)
VIGESLTQWHNDLYRIAFRDLTAPAFCPHIESSHWPSQFHHTGPFHDGEGREKVDFPWERLTGEPLIYASMGTILNGEAHVFRTIVAALAKHKDKLTADHLSTLLNEVLNDSTHRDNARKLQKAIARVNGLSVAADLVEESLE